MRKAKFKKPTKKRLDIERPHNGSQWSRARMISFIKSALRGARWPQKYVCIKNAYVEDGINPKTGRKCKLHKCPQCEELVTQNEMVADHLTPVIGPEGFIDWNTFIERLFCEADGFAAICKKCHKRITKHENQVRKETKDSQLKLI